MELRHLRQILEICRTGSFSGAAQSLHLSQPALSRSIARLEAELAVRLFDRDGGAARPTEYGLLIAARAETLLSAVASLTRDVAQMANGGGGRLRIGVGSATRLKPLPDVITRVMRRFPDLQIETHHAEVDAILRSLKAGRYELAFCYAAGAEPYSDLMRVKIFEDRNVAAVRPGHPLLSEASVTPEKMLKYSMASFPVSRAFWRWAGDLTPENLMCLEAFVSDEHELIKLRPIDTDYIAIAPAFIFEQEFIDGTLIQLNYEGLPTYECWMLTTRALWQSPIIKIVAEIAQSAVTGPAVPCPP
jgi:DNA-binding transcriptional LysR family regulator